MKPTNANNLLFPIADPIISTTIKYSQIYIIMINKVCLALTN